VVIRAAAGRQVDALVADLSSASAVAREAAVARLTVIGERAVSRLVAVAGADVAPPARAAALEALAAIGDARAIDVAADAAAASDPSVGLAAVGVLRGALKGVRGTAALDGLTRAALDGRRDLGVRAAAIDALATLAPATRTLLWKALAEDPRPEIRALVGGGRREPVAAQHDLASLADEVPDEPDAVRHAASRAPADTPLSTLQQLLERLREREAAAPEPRRGEWRSARAAVHLALARRHSRLGLYDLREWLQQAEGPLPVEAIAALEQVGDRSCLEPIAAAARSAALRGGTDDWWRTHLADAFAAIMAREHLTRRHAVIRRIDRRWGLPVPGPATPPGR
jgi:hypothetical protein